MNKKLKKYRGGKFYQNCHNFYYEKTLNRVDFFSNSNLVDRECKINNVLVPSLEK